MRLAGVVLLLLLPLLVADGVISAWGRFMGAFWASERDWKARTHRGSPTSMGGDGGGVDSDAGGGHRRMSAFGVLLSHDGEWLLASIALGVFVLGVVSMLTTAYVLFGSVGVAAQVRGDSKATPGWLEPMWVAANWAEVSYIVLTGLAYVVLGIGMVRSGFPATWAAWASLAIGGASVIGMVLAPARFTFPQLPLLVPVVLGVALITT